MKWTEREIVGTGVRVFEARYGWRDGDGIGIEVYPEYFEMDILSGAGFSRITIHLMDYSAFSFEGDFMEQTFQIAEHVARFFGVEEWDSPKPEPERADGN